jgi:malate dehydrogenase (oxaloacetate-decarboxylating)(NADP+)
MIRAANMFAASGLGRAILVGREDRIHQTLAENKIELHEDVEISNARVSSRNVTYANFLYERRQRLGFLLRDCQRLVNQDRNVFAACMVAMGDADAVVTGLTRNFSVAVDNVRHAIDHRAGHRPIGVSMALVRGRTVFIADTSIHELPSATELADIAQEAAGVARRFGYEPRVALLSYSTFGYPRGERAEYVRQAVSELDKRQVDFEYDGEMAADVALSREAMALYPFCRLTGPANVLVMPAAHSASISTKMLQQLGGVTVVGPLLTGFAKPVQIASMSATTAEILNLAAIAAFDINR